jgi:hypothetical protein
MDDKLPNPEDQRLLERYRSMSDIELALLAAETDDLTEAAQQALRAELARRGIEPAASDNSLADESSQDHRPPVIVGRFQNLHEALLAKGQLDSAGIPNSLADDNMVRMDWFYSNLLGGVKVLVRAQHEEAALEVLSQPIPESFDVEGVGKYEQPRCPKCQSTDISFESLEKLPSYGSMMLIGVPIPFGAETWRCHACGSTWEGTEDVSPADHSEGV